MSNGQGQSATYMAPRPIPQNKTGETRVLTLVGMEHLFVFAAAAVGWVLYSIPNEILEDMFR